MVFENSIGLFIQFVYTLFENILSASGDKDVTADSLLSLLVISEINGSTHSYYYK